MTGVQTCALPICIAGFAGLGGAALDVEVAEDKAINDNEMQIDILCRRNIALIPRK